MQQTSALFLLNEYTAAIDREISMTTDQKAYDFIKDFRDMLDCFFVYLYHFFFKISC